MVEASDLATHILTTIKKHVETWNADPGLLPEDLTITRLSGLSNACYKVALSSKHSQLQPSMLLFRNFECPIVDWTMENEIFESLSDQGLGPKLYHQSSTYRIEEFFLSRPVTIFEMRNPIFIKNYARRICDFNYNEQLIKKVAKYIPKDKMYIERVCTEWFQIVAERLPKIRTAYAGQEGI